jgi:hypothetical protein
MAQIATLSSNQVFEQFRGVSGRVKRSTSLQRAAQIAADALWETFAESLVLVRLFGVLAYDKLPPVEREFVDKLARAKGLSAEVGASTPILCLLGTRGVEREWNDRKGSKGHLAIPLASAAFIQSVPMISRMLFELGVNLALDNPSDKTIVTRVLSGGLGGLFYVEDAAATTDKAGRKVIAAQDFVRKHQVRTVFGVAGQYAGSLSIAALFFTKDNLPREIASQFLPFVNQFKASTMELVTNGRIFG